MRSLPSVTEVLFCIIAGVMAGTCVRGGDARAQDAPAVELPAPEALEAACAPEVTQGRRQLLEVEGQPGIWFHADVARCMAGRLALLPRYARHTRLLTQRLILSDERDGLRAREVALAAAEADTAGNALVAAERRAREAEEARDAWWRHPALWVAIGVVLTVAVEVAAVVILREVGE